MNLFGWVELLAACLAILLVVACLVYGARSISAWAMIVSVGVLSIEAVLTALAFFAESQERMLFWQGWSQTSMALVPGTWLTFALTFARGNRGAFLKKWALAVIAAYIVPLACAPFAAVEGIASLQATGSPLEWRFTVLWPARVIHVTCLLAAVAALINIEWTFRSSVGATRWSVKYAVVGCSILLGTRIYTSSQTLVYSGGITIGSLVFNAIALIVACVLLGVSLVRSRKDPIELYPSASVIYRSLTAVLVGLYLLLVGLLAERIRTSGGESAFPFLALMLFLSIAALGIMAFSDRIRQRLRLLISRHFARPLHDYRQVWSSFTERTAAVVDQENYCQSVVRLVAETFEVLSISIWLDQERTGLLERKATTTANRVEFQAGDDATMAVIRRACKAYPLPLNLDEGKPEWNEVLRRLNPSRFTHGGHRLAVPLVSSGEFVGLLVLGDRVSGLPFTQDDKDLLKCIGDQVAANLRNLRLSSRLVELKELEAFQMFSTFLVHDLKNTASTLSLMLRNMREHFSNPAFREDALRGLGKSVERINDLIQRLTNLRQQPSAMRQVADLIEVVDASAGKLDGQTEVELHRKLEPLPRLLLDPQQMESVFTNLLLNARDAVGQGGRITISSRQFDEWAMVAIEDNGCGMTPEFVARSLFRPFQTTKQKGMGIGMFQSKMIVEAHGGRIEVQTAPGRGTTFRVYLPLLASQK
jgi:putative PEP-CTERM system histidine kinase